MYNKNLNKMTQEQLRMQMLAGIITEGQYKAKLNEENEKTLNFGPFKNVEYYLRPEEGKIFLTVTESDKFRELENSLEYTSDELTDEQRNFLNDKVDSLAQEMSDYLASIGVANDIYDNPIGYGQEIDNLVVAFDKEDLSKLQ